MKLFTRSILPLIMLLFAVSANGQFVQMTNFIGTVAYGGVNVTVTPGGSFTTGGGICFGPPTEYWAGPGGPGWYDYVFSVPVYRIKVRSWGINGGPLGGGEYVRNSINGSVYALQPADVVSYTECSPGGGPMYINAGDWMGPVGTTGNYNGGTYIITFCTGITSCRVWCNGSLSGVAYWAFFDPTKPPSCVAATNNSPCIGDSLKLNLEGDSTGATYLWTGPLGFTSTLQSPWIYPSTFADSGWYKVIRHAGVVNDTDSTHVVIHPKPVMNVTSNAPLCVGMVDTLKLFVNPGGLGDLYSWTGPNSFSSTVEYPTRPGYVAIDTGVYTVIETTPFGCKDTAHIDVGLIPPPPPPVITGDTVYPCGATFVPFIVTGVGVINWYTSPSGPSSLIPTVVNTSLVGVYTVYVTQSIGACESPMDSIKVRVLPMPTPTITGDTAYCYGYPFVPFVVSGAGTVNWFPTDTSTVGTTTTAVVNTTIPGIYTFYANRSLGTCISLKDSITVKVYPQIVPNFTYMIHRGCTSDQVLFTNISTGANSYSWDFGDASLRDPSTNPPVHTYNAQGVYTVTLTANNVHPCYAHDSMQVDTRHSVTALFAPTPDTFCINPLQSTTLIDNSTAFVNLAPNVPSPGYIRTYQWSYGDGATDTNRTQPPHTYNQAGNYIAKLVVTDSIGCMDSTTRPIAVLRVDIKSLHDTALCLIMPLPLNNLVTVYPIISNPNFTYAWAQNTDNLDNPNVQIPFVTGFGAFSDTLTATIEPWGCFARDTINIHSIKGAVLTNVTASATIHYGTSIQLNASNEVYYYWKPNDGSLNNNNINNPIASPQQNTVYTVYGYDKNGCMDSANVNVTLDYIGDGIPSAFTPNGDGLNDIFRPALNFQKLVDFSVYNRWGQQVFQTNDKAHGWDGTYQGKPLDMGVYYYMIIVGQPDGQNIIYKGEVTLIR